MVRRRVILGFAPTRTGGNALWWSVGQAADRGATLYVVVRRQDQLTAAPRHLGSTVDRAAADRSARDARIEVQDALLLAVGEPPAGLDIRVAVVCVPVLNAVRQLADRPDDLVVLAAPPRRWRGPAELFVAVDPVTPPERLATGRESGRSGQFSRFLPR